MDSFDINLGENLIELEIPGGARGLKGDKGDTGNTGPQGQQGVPGTDGQDGVSPTITSSKSGKTTTLTITDKNGTSTATILDGNDGTNGTNGVSPTITSSKSGKTTTLTITDAGGTSTATILDGEDGTSGINIVSSNSSNNPFVLLGKKAGIYVFTDPNMVNEATVYIKYSDSNTSKATLSCMGGYLIVLQDINDSNGQTGRLIYYTESTTGYTCYGTYSSFATTGLSIGTVDYKLEDYYILKKYNQSLTKKLTFTGYLPESSIVPTSANQLVNKAYVDGLVGDIETVLTTLDIGSGV